MNKKNGIRTFTKIMMTSLLAGVSSAAQAQAVAEDTDPDVFKVHRCIHLLVDVILDGLFDLFSKDEWNEDEDDQQHPKGNGCDL